MNGFVDIKTTANKYLYGCILSIRADPYRGPRRSLCYGSSQAHRSTTRPCSSVTQAVRPYPPPAPPPACAGHRSHNWRSLPSHRRQILPSTFAFFRPPFHFSATRGVSRRRCTGSVCVCVCVGGLALYSKAPTWLPISDPFYIGLRTSNFTLHRLS